MRMPKASFSHLESETTLSSDKEPVIQAIKENKFVTGGRVQRNYFLNYFSGSAEHIEGSILTNPSHMCLSFRNKILNILTHM